MDIQTMDAQRPFTLQDIYRFFQTPQVIFLNQQLTVCYLLSILVESDSYGTEFVQSLKQNYPGYRLSDTILQSSLRFLEKEGLVSSYWKKPEKRGRPRRMYQLSSSARPQAEELSTLWREYVLNHPIETGDS
ncbi:MULTISPECIES: PadR family transcriptional regulator [Leptolyngbya]|jgi:DNA-binding PadR family transcriptional regulator|nr:MULTISPECIES: PadR family transcriptional regulator [Leptolyngbya]MCY6489079.1 PadR family transcriptional regulator [Leptolyngbya sp. GGD]ULP30013.1 PadR family transcriptional regulator [Leptolyngbya boryana IU 594]WNZ48297.1 PadR family transcriptional regulator [Leptolyngbya boryana CZ1]BAS54898.1 putative transcriptional regulator [Leptolyngbya boryana IAM M-101]BAS61246.1 putative transcriptional regulator [Leptolyngbya boryana dg5]